MPQRKRGAVEIKVRPSFIDRIESSDIEAAGAWFVAISGLSWLFYALWIMNHPY